MTQQLLTMSYITNEALVVLENELVIANRVERQYSNEFAQTGAKVGNTVNIRRPPRYIGTYGPPLNVEDTFETYVPVVLNYQYHVDVQFTTQDLALSMDMFKKRILKPQIATVANRIDADSAQYYTYNTAISLGVPGVQPASFKVFSDARATLAMEACPTEGEKNCVLDPITMSAVTDSQGGKFNPQARISEFNEKGLIAKEWAGLDFWEDQNILSFSTGTNTGTASSFQTLTGAYSNSALLGSGWAASGTLTVQGFTATSSVCKVGDVFTIANVYPVNPQNRLQYGRSLKQFVVLPAGGFGTPPNGAATTGIYFNPATLTNGTFNNLTGVYTSDGSGYCTLNIGEAVIYGGQFQNCTLNPPSGSLVTFNSSAAAGTVTPQGSGIPQVRLCFGVCGSTAPAGC